MENALVSIIVPVFRVEEYLKRCIESMINQTYKNIEIILVDDGSDDNCPKICDEYSKKDQRITVIHKQNGGLSDARNFGIKKSKGEYITFVDSDDTIEPDYIECLLNTLIKNNADISICGYMVKYDNGKNIPNANGKKLVLNSKETLENMLYQEDFNVASWAKLYKRNLFDKIEFPVGKIHEDAFTTYKLVLKSKTIACDLKPLYNYMIRSNSILTGKFSEKKLLVVDAYDEMEEVLLKKYEDLKDAAIRGKVYARISCLRQMINCKPRLVDLEKKFRKEILSYKKNILFDKKAAKRDKIAIITLLFGRNAFRLSWNIYCKITGRNM